VFRDKKNIITRVTASIIAVDLGHWVEVVIQILQIVISSLVFVLQEESSVGINTGGNGATL